MILSGPLLQVEQVWVSVLSAACFSLRLVMPFARDLPICFSLALKSLLMSVSIFFASSRILVSWAWRVFVIGEIASSRSLSAPPPSELVISEGFTFGSSVVVDDELVVLLLLLFWVVGFSFWGGDVDEGCCANVENSCMCSSNFLVRFSSRMMGLCSSSDSMRCIPNGVALMDFPSR